MIALLYSSCPERVFLQRAESRLLEMPTASGENTIQRSSLLSAHLKGIHKMYLTSITKRIKNAEPCRPNAAHIAIANFQKEMAPFCDVIHVTQNVDNLNELAGAPRVFHLHGDFQTSLCRKCKKTFPRVGFYEREQVCPVCEATNFAMRPMLCFSEKYLTAWIGYLRISRKLRLYFRRHFRHRLSCGQFRERNESIDKKSILI